MIAARLPIVAGVAVNGVTIGGQLDGHRAVLGTMTGAGREHLAAGHVAAQRIRELLEGKVAQSQSPLCQACSASASSLLASAPSASAAASFNAAATARSCSVVTHWRRVSLRSAW